MLNPDVLLSFCNYRSSQSRTEFPLLLPYMVHDGIATASSIKVFTFKTYKIHRNIEIEAALCFCRHVFCCQCYASIIFILYRLKCPSVLIHYNQEKVCVTATHRHTSLVGFPFTSRVPARLQWSSRASPQNRHAPLKRRAHLPQVPTQHLWPLPLPRMPAPEAPACQRWDRHRDSCAAANICQRSWRRFRYWDRPRQGRVSDTDPVADRWEGHEQQGRRDELVQGKQAANPESWLSQRMMSDGTQAPWTWALHYWYYIPNTISNISWAGKKVKKKCLWIQSVLKWSPP